MSKRKIDDATRDAAATLCLLMAEHHISSSTGASPASCEDDDAVESLSHIAWIAACHTLVEVSAVLDRDLLDAANIELEAAALLLDGWCPGDPVVRLGR